MSYFKETEPYIVGNKKLRVPQIEAYMKIVGFFTEKPSGEALVVLPTGTGKSGLISIAPYGISDGKVLIITPGIVTKKSIVKTLHPLDENFWINQDVFFDPEDLPVVEEYQPDMLDSSLGKCDFLITNIHKLSTYRERSLLNRVKPDFFDMVIVDEAHHAPANTWQEVLSYFSEAKKLHVTGTPYRGDGLELPGELIHNTSLSSVMALKYVKWLRKETVSNSELYFTIPGTPDKLAKEEVLLFKDKEWIERSVALSEECSHDVIQHSIKQLNTIREASPKIPHKILAVACSIAHAEDLCKWYYAQGMNTVLIHSDMDYRDQEQCLLKIENNQCDVVVSVNMLMEGYDHKYLTVLALFRPFRSLNAFAQVVGRVLRAIPEDEIKDFRIDNNAVLIYHRETGLDEMWDFFYKEVQKAEVLSRQEYSFSDREYQQRNLEYADVEPGEAYVCGQESYLAEVDFNKKFEEARIEIDKDVEEKISKLPASDFDADDLDAIRSTLKKRRIASKSSEFDKLLHEKRPELARRQRRQILYENANEAAQSLLREKNIDPKSKTLLPKLQHIIPFVKDDTPNDGLLVIYINTKLSKRFGPVKDREPGILLLSQEYMNEVVNELRRMI